MLRRARRLAVLTPGLRSRFSPSPALAVETFDDGFESGDFSAWTSRSTGGDGTATVQSATVHSGTFAARLTASAGSGSFAQARKTFASAQADLSASGWFRVQAEGAANSNVPLLRLFDTGGARVVSVFRQNGSSDRIYVQHSGAYNLTTGEAAAEHMGPVRPARHGRRHERGRDRAARGRRPRLSGDLGRPRPGAHGSDRQRRQVPGLRDRGRRRVGDRGQRAAPSARRPRARRRRRHRGLQQPRGRSHRGPARRHRGHRVHHGDNVYPTGTLDAVQRRATRRPGAVTRRAPGPLPATTSTTPTAPPATSTTSARRPASPARATTATTSATGTSSCSTATARSSAAAARAPPRSSGCAHDLAAHPADCTLAYWHHPRFSSGGEHGSAPGMEPFWQRAVRSRAPTSCSAGTTTTTSASRPRTPIGNADASTGSASSSSAPAARATTPFATPLPNSEVRNDDTFGVLKLTLHPGTYDWAFVPEAGKSFTDSGTGSCHGAPPAPPPSPTLFSDGFESGDFSAWTLVRTGGNGSAIVQGALVHDGAHAARLNATTAAGSFAYARRSFAQARTDLTVERVVPTRSRGRLRRQRPAAALVRLERDAARELVPPEQEPRRALGATQRGLPPHHREAPARLVGPASSCAWSWPVRRAPSRSL